MVAKSNLTSHALHTAAGLARDFAKDPAVQDAAARALTHVGRKLADKVGHGAATLQARAHEALHAASTQPSGSAPRRAGGMLAEAMNRSSAFRDRAARVAAKLSPHAAGIADDILQSAGAAYQRVHGEFAEFVAATQAQADAPAQAATRPSVHGHAAVPPRGIAGNILGEAAAAYRRVHDEFTGFMADARTAAEAATQAQAEALAQAANPTRPSAHGHTAASTHDIVDNILSEAAATYRRVHDEFAGFMANARAAAEAANPTGPSAHDPTAPSPRDIAGNILSEAAATYRRVHDEFAGFMADARAAAKAATLAQADALAQARAEADRPPPYSETEGTPEPVSPTADRTPQPYAMSGSLERLDPHAPVATVDALVRRDAPTRD